ncbi:MAG: NAD-dependent epimerase/dehydratase family protein [Oligoflexia bacterium]|nr:NAD-dependent epimerase/dehydratase family protein [Oligoflexia bacterium]
MSHFEKEILKSIEINEIQKLTELKNKIILVTGGTGFLGLWIAETIRLLNEKFSFNTSIHLLSRDPYKNIEKAPHLFNDKSINFIEKDVRDIFELPVDIDFVIHAASDPDTRAHSSNPLNVIETAIKGTDNVLSACMRSNRIKKILLVSSGLVSGVRDVDSPAIKENSYTGIDPTSISNVYAESKRMAESIAFSYKSLYKLPIVISRPFTFVGPYQSMEKPWVINNFIRDASSGGPIRILGNKNTRRSYIYGTDAASWTIKILINGAAGQIYNVAGKDSFSVQEIAEKVQSAMNKNVAISYDSTNDSLNSNMFVADLEQSLGLRLHQTISIDESIQHTIKWHLLRLQHLKQKNEHN